MTEATFTNLNLESRLLLNLESLGYVAMTQIQAQSLPHILAGKDVIGQGKTGSGKTAAFGLGLLQKLKVERFRIQSLVLCPTRELADQVAKEIRRLGRGIHNIKVLTLCGGTAFGPQLGSLEHGAHIIVGTPGRVEEHLRKGSLKLPELNLLVLDEADRMLDMGFQPTLDAIISYLPKARQTLLFSATYPDEIKAIAERVMVDPVLVQVASTHDTGTIEQKLYQVADNTGRTAALQLLLLHYRPDSALVFCNTKRETQAVADELTGLGFVAQALHGDLEQRDRDETLVRFANKSTSVLVATDVAARGLDIDAIDTVINYHVPRELEVYIHRIGRTARAGSKGVACTLFTDKEERKISRLEEFLGHKIDRAPLPVSELKDQPA
ncbi:MAG: ATP-dependent RNA helicase DbpA, partial [Pseudomonadales bacterium]